MSELLRSVLTRPDGLERYGNLLLLGLGPAPGGRYRHWDTFRQVESEDGVSVEERWLAVKQARRALYQSLPFTDTEGQPFVYVLPGVALDYLHRIDRDASGSFRAPEQVTNPQTRDRYLIAQLMEEAITSSQLEGASTTRVVAKQMLQEGREPRNRSERMIFNNYSAMQFIRSQLGQPLSPEVILRLQAILTEGTLDDPGAAGRLRRPDEPIGVVDAITGKLLHAPPPAEQLESRLRGLCTFANDRAPEPFIHPVVRAIVLHFWIGYDHPFVDGNGRTARALFYWSMATQGYWLAEYLSISSILKKAPARYAESFLYTETDENDFTYFLLSQLRVVLRAMDALHEYLAKKAAEIRRIDELVQRSRRLKDRLNHRQLAILNNASKEPTARYTISSHRRAHDVSYETARSDLLELARLRLLVRQTAGRTFVFVPARDLEQRLTGLANAGR